MMDFSEATGIPFIASPVSQIFAEMGFTVGQPLCFEQRMELQEETLKRHQDAIFDVGGAFVSDRTTLDFAAYTVAEWGMMVTAENDKRLADYVDKCLTSAQKLYSMTILIQPGIPFVDEAQKGRSGSWQELHTTLLSGFMHDHRFSVGVPLVMPKRITGRKKRLNTVLEAWKSSLKLASEQCLVNVIH